MLALVGTMLLVACGAAPPSPVGPSLNLSELKLRVMDAVGTPVYCDPDFYPIAREGGEQANAISQYPTILSCMPRSWPTSTCPAGILRMRRS
jgi:hypothetical protein